MCLCLQSFYKAPSNPGIAPMLHSGACLQLPFLFFLSFSQKAEAFFPLLAFSQLPYVFSSHLFRIGHHNNPTHHHCLSRRSHSWSCCGNTSTVEGVFWATRGSSPAAWGHVTWTCCHMGTCHLNLLSHGDMPPDPAIAMPCFLSH